MPEKWWRNLAALLMTAGYACLDPLARARWKVGLDLARQFAKANRKEYGEMVNVVMSGEELDLTFHAIRGGDVEKVRRISDEIDRQRNGVERKCEPRKRMDNPWSESVN